MLDVLESKGIYRKSYCQFFGGGHLFKVPDGFYDAVIISGAFVKGHLPIDALRESARVTKKGRYELHVAYR